MFATGLIFFREIMEIALILGLVMAATRGVPGRNHWVLVGIGGGVLGSAMVAYFAGSISEAMEGMGQELFNALILFIAATMIGWTVIWMRSHGRELAMQIRHVGHKITAGELPLHTLAVVVALAMWREGAEIVLFMYGILSTSTEPLAYIILGGVVGASIAATLGVLLYYGLIKLSQKHLFAVTGWLLILLACGMSAQAAGYLIAADWLPALASPLWDTSAILSQESLLGRILHAILGYSDRPSGMQAVFYLGTLGLLLALQRWHAHSQHRKTSGNSSASPASA